MKDFKKKCGHARQPTVLSPPSEKVKHPKNGQNKQKPSREEKTLENRKISRKNQPKKKRTKIPGRSKFLQ